MKTLLQFIILIVTFSVNAQIIPLKLEEKIEKSPFIVEGKIIDQNSYKTENSIYTNYTLQVTNVLKGNLTDNVITVKAIGGTVGNQKLVTCPSDNFHQDENTIFFLEKIVNQNVFQASFFGQSTVSLEHISDKELTKISKSLGYKYSKVSTNSQKNSAIAATITNISPTTVNAGVGETITITGSGFGASGPTSGIKVWTKFANNPSQMKSHSAAYNYVSWSDTQIVFKVPSDAGTGQIWVGSGSSHATSTQVVTVATSVRDNANAVNSAIYPVSLPSLQNQGIQFVLNTNFTNTDAINRTKEALQQWQCETNIDFTLDETTTTANTNNVNDGLSVLYFDTSMSSSTLGVTLTSLSACSGSGRWYVNDVDLAMNGNTNFNFSLNATGASQIDYYSVMLHELGHVRNLGHVLNGSQVMYPSIGAATDKRTLHPNDVIGGNLVQNDSNTNQVCGNPLMVDASCSQQLTYVPDDAFEQKLINLGYDIAPLDDYVPTSNINTITNLTINGDPISDLTGIEDFIALEYFTLKYTNVTNLDLSNNTALIKINCPSNIISNLNINGLSSLTELILFDNNISSINLSTNTSLIKFNGGYNPYTTLDFSNCPNIEWIGSPHGSLTSVNLTGVTLLEEVYLNNNQLTSIDVSNNSSLFWLDVKYNNVISINILNTAALQYCYVNNNQLSSLDVSGNVNLLALDCSTNNLSSIDVSSCSSLLNFYCAYNQLTALDINNNPLLQFFNANDNLLNSLLLTNATSLINLNLSNNQLTNLDLSNSANLYLVDLSNNSLTALNVKNGNNTYINNFAFNTTNNSSLTCIEVDNASYSTSNWANIDATTSFSEDCSILSITDVYLNEIKLFPNPATNIINITSNTNISDFKFQLYDLNGRLINKGDFKTSKTINVSHLQSGVYLIKIYNSSQNQIVKFIKN